MFMQLYTCSSSLVTLLSTPVQLVINWCVQAYRHDQNNLLNFKLDIRMGEKGDLSESEHDMVVGWSEYFRNFWYWDFPTQPSLGFMWNGPGKRKQENGQTVLSWKEISNSKASLNAQHVKLWSRPHQVSLKNRKLRLQFMGSTKLHNKTWKRLENGLNSFRIGPNWHKSMNLALYQWFRLVV